jgi:lipopolysaccharide transport system permease protein
VYPVSAVPPFLAELLQWNPLTAIFEFFRMGFLGSGNPNFTGLLKSTVIIALLFGVGVLIFNKVEKDFMDTV